MDRLSFFKKLSTYLRIGGADSYYEFIIISAKLIYGENPEDFEIETTAANILRNFFGIIPQDILNQIQNYLLDRKNYPDAKEGFACKFCGKRRQESQFIKSQNSKKTIGICQDCFNQLKQTVTI